MEGWDLFHLSHVSRLLVAPWSCGQEKSYQAFVMCQHSLLMFVGPWDACSCRRDEGSAFAPVQLSDSSEHHWGLWCSECSFCGRRKKSYLPHNLISSNWAQGEGRINNGRLDFKPSALWHWTCVCVSCSLLSCWMLIVTGTRPGSRVWSMKVMSQRKQEDPQRISGWVKRRETA